ncbi:hypothetical protein [Cellulomonas sp. URHB0016]
MALLGGLLAACSGGGGAPTSTASSGDEAETSITTVDSLEGATRRTLDGVSILVPEGMDVEEHAVSDIVNQLILTRPGEPRANNALTVTREKVGDDNVDAGFALARAKIGASGSFTESSTETATWEGLGHAVVLRGTLGVPDGEKDVMFVITRTEDGSRLISVSAEAPLGEMDGSVPEQILRSVRAEG